jgi:hypothetical protein
LEICNTRFTQNHVRGRASSRNRSLPNVAGDQARRGKTRLRFISRDLVSTGDGRRNRTPVCGVGKCIVVKRNSLSALDAIRQELKSCKDPIERVRLVRRAREMRGTMLEICESLPDAETARQQLNSETNGRVRAILRRYVKNLDALNRS